MLCPIKLEKKYHFSPLRYPGGKSCLTSFLDWIIKRNDLSDGVYIEPYAGGAGAALSLLLLEKVERIIVNDLDPAIYAFWKSIVNHTDEFTEKIDSTPVEIKEWYRQKEISRNKSSSVLEMGFATFFLNRTNRSGILNGGPIGGNKQDGRWKIDARFNKKELIGRIQKIAYYRNRIKITNEDGIKLLYRMKKSLKTSKQFIYLDPPYYQKGGSLYMNFYKKKDHERLADFLNKNLLLNWVLTYDNVDDIKNLYKKRRIEKFSINYSAYKKIKDYEVMIFSDALSIA